MKRSQDRAAVPEPRHEPTGRASSSPTRESLVYGAVSVASSRRRISKSQTLNGSCVPSTGATSVRSRVLYARRGVSGVSGVGRCAWYVTDSRAPMAGAPGIGRVALRIKHQVPGSRLNARDAEPALDAGSSALADACIAPKCACVRLAHFNEIGHPPHGGRRFLPSPALMGAREARQSCCTR